MPPIYKRYLKNTLSDVVNELCSATPYEQLQLFEEVALMRDAAGRSVSMYAAAREAVAANPADKRLRELEHDAALLMMSALQQVAPVVQRAAAINAAAKDKISVYTLQHFVDQLVIVAHSVFGDDPRVEEFRQAIRERVKIPSGGNHPGTDRLPSDVLDAQIDAMDASVPSAPAS